MTTLTKIIDVSTTVAFVTPAHSWVLGKVAAYDMKTKHYTCTTTDPEPMSVSAIKANSDSIWAPRVEYLEEEVDDLLQLTELHEATLLFCLKRRYYKDIVYTNIGPIVVALNPFNYNIPWYMDSKMPDYLVEGVEIEHNLPHSWAVAHNTYWEMVENRSNQTILISGESGAGKTEAAKIVVKYLGALSTKNGTEDQQEACRVVNRKVNAASPILEAFGNAKTVRNDNSSRFGKFAKIQFDRDGFLIGSYSIKYLLEKSRIISAAQDERVYHSFYQLAQSDAGRTFHIRNPKLHRMLSSGSCIHIENVDDAVDFVATQQAMVDVNVSDADQQAIWLTVAGILFFQNIEFEESDEKAGLTASIDPSLEQVLGRACELWGMDPVGMKRELLTSTIVARGESTIKVLSKAQASDTRDSISKGLYDWLFDWLVNKINNTVDCSSHCERWIGLLDIFGFENFQQNNFEQLCINLANETLQSHYNSHIFTRDMKECQEEGIDTTDVRFVDNKECIELLTNKNGVFTMLDDECMVNGTERNFLQKLNASFMSAKSKPGHPFFGQVTGKAMDNGFKIKHYAADVVYTVDGFLDKNRDNLKDGMKVVLSQSSIPLIKSLIPALQDGGSRGGGKVTVGMFFRRQLQELMDLISSTNPHWIRCIKPHPAKQPRMFSHLEVMTQLRSAGVLDTVKVRKAGFPIRFKLDVFLLRYRILIPKSAAAKDPRGICAQMFDSLEITSFTGQLGKTKVFLRQEAFTKLNHAKDQATQEYALIFQRAGRACWERASLFKVYVKRHHAKIMEDRRRREEAQRRKREEEAARRQVELAERAKKEEADRERRQYSAVIIQRRVRGMLSRSSFARSYIEGARAHEERRLDDTFQRYRATFEDTERRIRIVEKRHLEAVEVSKVVAIKQTHEHKRKELFELREERTRAIREAEARRQAMIETEVRADLDQQRRARREKEAKELQELSEKRRQRRDTQAAVREHQEERQIEKLQQMMTNRQLRQNQTSTWQSNLSNRMAHVDAEKDLRRGGGIQSTMYPVSRNAGSPTRSTPMAQAVAPIVSPHTPTAVERRFEGLKGSYALEEAWLATREHRAHYPPEEAAASPMDRHLEIRYRNRVLDDAFNRAEMARLLQERRSGL